MIAVLLAVSDLVPVSVVVDGVWDGRSKCRKGDGEDLQAC